MRVVNGVPVRALTFPPPDPASRDLHRPSTPDARRPAVLELLGRGLTPQDVAQALRIGLARGHGGGARSQGLVGRAWLFETDWPPLVRARASAHVPLPSIVRQFMAESPFVVYLVEDAVDVAIAGSDVEPVLASALLLTRGRQFAWQLSASDEVAAVALRSLAGGEVLGVGRA